VIECLPSKHEALSSNPSITKKEETKNTNKMERLAGSFEEWVLRHSYFLVLL
jgi:hypothetical protein